MHSLLNLSASTSCSVAILGSSYLLKDQEMIYTVSAGFDSLDEDVTSSEDEEPSGNPAKSTVDGQSLINPARVRRRALFSGNADSALEAAESPGSEETDDDLDEEREDGQAANGVLEEEDEVEEDSEGDPALMTPFNSNLGF